MSTSTPFSSQSNPVTSTSDSWESRIQTAATFMGLSTETVEKGLKTLGVEKEPAGLEMLSDECITPFGDIRAIFCDNALFGKVPIAKVRLAMKYLRGPQGSNKTDSIDPEIVELKTKYGIKMKMEDIDPSELLQYYHPEQSNHPITIALKKKFGNKPIIVFKPDSKAVDIEETSNYIADLEQGFPEQEIIESNGCLVRIYPIGQIPNQMVEEDPLFENKPLKRGRSIINRLNWSEIGKDVRMFCRIIVERKEINIEDRFALGELFRLAKKGISELQKVYPEAHLEYRERAQKGELPHLLISIEEISGKTQNPFGINRKF